MAVQPGIITVRRRERLFYMGMAIPGTPAWLAFAGWLTR